MTYKLEPALSRITSPVLLTFPDGKEQKYSSGEEVCDVVFTRKYNAAEIRAVGNMVNIKLEEVDILETNWIGEEQTFF